jgi:hypothetical protein
MTKRSQSQNDTPSARDITLGRDRFAKISAVEGVFVSRAGTLRAEEADRKGLSGAERRRRIEHAYRKN